jgi:hypothetical protein
MPTIDLIDGIKICIYCGEHRPPHFHALYNEYEVVLEIETCEIYAGNSEWALEVFYELNPELL